MTGLPWGKNIEIRSEKKKHILNLLKPTIIAYMHIICHCLKTKTEQTIYLVNIEKVTKNK